MNSAKSISNSLSKSDSAGLDLKQPSIDQDPIVKADSESQLHVRTDAHPEVEAEVRSRWLPPVIDESDLRRELDHVSQELLAVRDALVGTQSEAGVLRAKLTELEAQLTSRDREIEELSERLLAANDKPTGAIDRVHKAESLLRPVARQLKNAATSKRSRR